MKCIPKSRKIQRGKSRGSNVTAKITENLDYDERYALLQEWPTFRAVQSRLYKKKYELVPRDPENMKDFDADLHCCNLSSGENIVKGDIVKCFQCRV